MVMLPTNQFKCFVFSLLDLRRKCYAVMPSVLYGVKLGLFTEVEDV